jgi:hypothetical protein
MDGCAGGVTARRNVLCRSMGAVAACDERESALAANESCWSPQLANSSHRQSKIEIVAALRIFLEDLANDGLVEVS